MMDLSSAVKPLCGVLWLESRNDFPLPVPDMRPPPPPVPEDDFYFFEGQNETEFFTKILLFGDFMLLITYYSPAHTVPGSPPLPPHQKIRQWRRSS